MLSVEKPGVRSEVVPHPLLDRQIEETTAGLPASYAKNLRLASETNASIIVAYISAMKAETNLSDNYRRDIIDVLTRFTKYNDNKPFQDVTRNDVLSFLENFRNLKPQTLFTSG